MLSSATPGYQTGLYSGVIYIEFSDDQILKEYYSLTEEDLDSEDIQYLMDDKFGYDEDVDDEKDKKKKNILKKREISKARNILKN